MDIYTIRTRYQNTVAIVTGTTDQTGATEWSCFTGRVAVQITGTGTGISVRVERSSLDPQGQLGANPAPADSPGVEITGNPSTGISPVAYLEPAVGWWRLVVTAIQGTVTLTMSGHHGSSASHLPGTPL